MSSGDNQAVQDVKPEQEPEVTPHVSEEEPAPERKEENCEVKQEQESDVKVKTEVTDETADVGLENELSKLTVDSQVNTSPRKQQESRVILTSRSSASLSNLLVYESSSEDSTDEEDNRSLTSKNNVLVLDSSSTSSYCSTELQNEIDDDSSLSDEEELRVSNHSNLGGCQKKKPDKFGDYIGKEPLPIPDVSKLNINVQQKDLIQIGNISAMVDEFVMVEALPGMPPYNLDTYFFLEDCKFLGAVFDVMGPVNSPIYVLRFKRVSDIAELKLKTNVKVYVSPQSEHTKYVFLRDLLSVKGSDASWVGDIEVPEEYEDYSDDEKEARKRSGVRSGTRKRNSLERHKKFEHKMNKRNTMDSMSHTAQHGNLPKPTDFQLPTPPVMMPVFDPRVPPPPSQYQQSPHPLQGNQKNWTFPWL